MAWYSLFTEAPDALSKSLDSFSGLVPILIIILLLIGILYWLRALQKSPRTEIRVYRRP